MRWWQCVLLAWGSGLAGFVIGAMWSGLFAKPATDDLAALIKAIRQEVEHRLRSDRDLPAEVGQADEPSAAPSSHTQGIARFRCL
jgi:hypothetical protein